MAKVRVAALLHSYTGGAGELEASGETLGELLAELERRFPGLRFRVVDEQDRIRPHMRIFVNQTLARSLRQRLEPSDEVMIVGGLSGG